MQCTVMGHAKCTELHAAATCCAVLLLLLLDGLLLLLLLQLQVLDGPCSAYRAARSSNMLCCAAGSNNLLCCAAVQTKKPICSQCTLQEQGTASCASAAGVVVVVLTRCHPQCRLGVDTWQN
jgi:hypothetical protein